MKFTLSARPPFNFHSIVNSHGWRQLAPFSYEETTGTLSYVLRLSNGRVIALNLRDAGDGVSVETEKLAKTERREVTEKVTWMFGLDMDFSRFYVAARGESGLANVKKLARGRVLRSPTLFEDVIKTILTTNTLWAATRNMTRKLVQELGEPLTSTIKAFPTPEVIAASRIPEGENTRRLSCARHSYAGSSGGVGNIRSRVFQDERVIDTRLTQTAAHHQRRGTVRGRKPAAAPGQARFHSDRLVCP